MFCNILPPLVKKKNPKTLADFNRLKSYSAIVYFRHLRNFASHKDANFLTIQNVPYVKGRSYIMEFWTSMYNMVSLQFPRDMKVGLPFTALSRDDSLECNVLHTTIRFVVERSSPTRWLAQGATHVQPPYHCYGVQFPQNLHSILGMLIQFMASVRLVSCSHLHCLQCKTDDLAPTQPPIT